MSFLQGLGHVAGGLAQGLERGQRIRGNNMAMEQQQRAADLAEQERQAIEQANKAGAEHFASLKTKAQPSGLDQYMTRGGGDATTPESMQDAAYQAPTANWQPSKRDILGAAQARTNKLFELGKQDLAVKHWLQDEQMRAQLRGAAGQEAKMAISTGGDATKALANYYDLFDNGDSVVSAVPQKSADGGSGYLVTRKDATGKEVAEFLKPEDIAGQIDYFNQKPDEAAKESIQQKLWLTRIKAQGEESRKTQGVVTDRVLAKAEADGEAKVAVQEVKNEGSLAVAGVNKDGRVESAKIRADGGITATQIRAAAKGGGSGGSGGGKPVRVQRTVNLADGRVVMVMSDGSNKVLTDEGGGAVRGIEAEKLLAGVTRDIGKTMEGSMAGYGTNRAAATNTLPKPPAQAPRPSLGDASPKSAPKKPTVSNW